MIIILKFLEVIVNTVVWCSNAALYFIRMIKSFCTLEPKVFAHLGNQKFLEIYGQYVYTRDIRNLTRNLNSIAPELTINFHGTTWDIKLNPKTNYSGIIIPMKKYIKITKLPETEDDKYTQIFTHVKGTTFIVKALFPVNGEITGNTYKVQFKP